MKNNNDNPIQVSDHALEMVMRDVLDGMLEFSLNSAYRSGCTDFEIIEISPGRSSFTDAHQPAGKNAVADVLPFPQLRKAAC